MVIVLAGWGDDGRQRLSAVKMGEKAIQNAIGLLEYVYSKESNS